MEKHKDLKISKSTKTKEDEEEEEEEENGDGKNYEGLGNLKGLDELMVVIDKNLEEKSKKVNLTAWNVKNIIYQVITNEDVQVMFRNQLEDGRLKERLREAIFEPKMTRSKLKEVIKSGQVPLRWGTTTSTKDKTLLEMNFEEEEEEDDEYMPSKDELARASDDDESAASSRASECGSPFLAKSSAFSSPELKRFRPQAGASGVRLGSPVAAASKGKATDEDKRSMGPPEITPPVKKLIQRHDEDSRQPHETEDGEGEEEEDKNTIALRTRSKLPLTDTSLTELESRIVDPDLFHELRDAPRPTSPENECWKEFLASLAEDEVRAPSEEDEDPEFNFIGEEEELNELDFEEVRCDKGAQISKKEVKSLMDEFFSNSWNCDEPDDFQQFSLLTGEDIDRFLEASGSDGANPEDAAESRGPNARW